ncbi:uncharacterized protein I303_100599 [Kwoniella dejecticola CBS 10117]|uniref:Uncharacterized protein n=1 Tax=Kwoniella dejecticola CBS 10117 TaxID=1296121 RepID=A0A1A6AFD8_9TREE|nr:uncharacterized protein I303_00602 [Kwoniella dejecticola CBS 10117]OBR88785.1 hypothetical protein I303_00602 [Kwoniella dejecticola CBS 10117]
MEMDMDVAWCLACSKQTRDPRSPYCSEACRLQDTGSSTVHANAVPLTSPVPFGLIPSPPHPTHSGNPTPKANNSPIQRPSIGPLAPLNSSYRSKPVPRDRRAFSFPATQSTPAVPVRISNSRRPTQTGETLQFARRANPVSVNMTASPSVGGLSVPRVEGFDKLSKTTGANTPIFQDSVFCSTSESSDNEAIDVKDISPMKMPRPLPQIESTVRPSNIKRASMSHVFPAPSPRVNTLHSVPQPPSRSSLVSRKSPSPVAAMIASSASSKSREDIVSWLNEVKRLPDYINDPDSRSTSFQSRGRSRTRREVHANLPADNHNHIEEHEGENETFGTTPKGRIGSALAGLSSFGGFGVGPIVKALTGVTSSASTSQSPPPPASTGLGLSSVPAATEVSRVAVTVATPNELENQNYFQMGGTTPTLSTISVSEVVDPLTDSGDHVDFMTTTDDQSANGSVSFMRRRSSGFVPTRAPASLLSIGGKQSPAKPVTSTTSAIWSLSSYLKSFTPFAISSVIPPYAPIAAAVVQQGNISSTSDNKTRDFDRPAPAPVPAARLPTPAPDESPAQQMVRSLPMDIVIPVGGENTNVDRARQREEAREWLGTPHSSRSPSRSQARPQSRSRGRHRSRSGCHSRSASHTRDHDRGRGHARKVSYDADESAEEDEDVVHIERRGRSRREKGLRMEESQDRGRRGSDVRAALEEERGRGRGRERDRTVRV